MSFCGSYQIFLIQMNHQPFESQGHKEPHKKSGCLLRSEKCRGHAPGARGHGLVRAVGGLGRGHAVALDHRATRVRH